MSLGEAEHYSDRGEKFYKSLPQTGGFKKNENEGKFITVEKESNHQYGWCNFAIPDGTIFIAEENENSEWQSSETKIEFTEDAVDSQSNGKLNRFIVACGQDVNGEIYLLTTTTLGPTGTTGQVFKIVSAKAPVEIEVEDFRFDADDNNDT